MVRSATLAGVAGLLLAAFAGVCPAQTLDGAATVSTLTGQVSVLRDSTPWALHLGDAIKPGQIVLTGTDGFAVFRLADGSTFEVFPNSRFAFRENPGNWRDLLELLLGRVKIHVQKLNGMPNRNKVRTPTAIISVRGTIFDVTVEEGDSTLVVVEEGQVAVEHRQFATTQPKLLNEGEWLRVHKDEPLAQKSVDKGGVIRAALRAIADAIYTAATRDGGSASPAPGGGTGPTLPGDHGNGGGNTGGNTGGGSSGGNDGPSTGAPGTPPPG